MIKLIKNLTFIFEINKGYRYFVYFIIFCFIYFGLFAEHGQSILGLIETSQYDLLWYYLGYLIGSAVVLSVIGLILFNRQAQYDEIQIQEFVEARKRFFQILSSSLGKGVVWFVLMVMAIMGTDSCESNCFPFQGYISLSMALYPVVVGITLIGAMYSLLLHEIYWMNRLLKISNMWLWSLMPIIFIIFEFIHF